MDGSWARWPGNVRVCAVRPRCALYAATCEPGAEQRGRVYRWDGESRWIDLGAPDACNSISSLASFGGSLYAGSSKYRLAGSASCRIGES